ncbi:hypothetical protein J6590_041698 [Homalodisca vitripennis]|nr:hypothetical protein J6590_041698 [Homalodisca vitripennis]
MEAAVDDRRNVDESPGFDGRQVPELYTLLDRGLGHFKQRAVTQHLGSLVDDLDIENLWSSRDVTLSFGPFFDFLLRLFTGPYETDEESVIVDMLRLGLERASGNFEYTDLRREGSTSTEPFFVTYRRKGRALRDFSAFRYMLEIVENMGRNSACSSRAPLSRCGEGGSKSDRSNKRPSTPTNRDYGGVRQPFRRPVFFAFKPISQAVTNKDIE